MRKSEYADKSILAMRSKYLEKLLENLSAEKGFLMEGKGIALQREELFDGRCSIMLPEAMVDMEHQRVMVIYRSSNRPQVVKTDYNTGTSMTFGLLPAEDMEEEVEIAEQLTKMCRDMKKIWKQNVFYDRGEVMADGVPVAWMEFKSFCLDGDLYSMIFIFQVEKQIVLGNFHCGFSQYDTWKPIMLKLLATVRLEGVSNSMEVTREVNVNSVKAD